jgi:polyhydroxybutyrate depolymerase
VRLGLAAVAALLVAPASFAVGAAVERATVTTADGPRTYVVARPSRRGVGLRPLVLVLHGHIGSAEQVLGLNGKRSPLAVWLDIAEREGAVVAALDGAIGRDGHRGWNDCRADAPGNPTTDDVAFARAVIARLEREDGVDPARIYAMGMSNGGFMAFRLALELDPPPAAVAAVSSSMAADSVCGPPRRPVSVLIVSGTADPVVPYAGGEVRILWMKRGSAVGIENAAAAWRRIDGISAPPVTPPIPHRDGADDPTRAMRAVWGADAGGLQVELIRIEGGGHIEPSLSQRYGGLYQWVVGRQSHDLESSEEAWQFFKGKRTVDPRK